MWQSLRLKSALSRGYRMLGALARGGGGGMGEEGVRMMGDKAGESGRSIA